MSRLRRLWASVSVPLPILFAIRSVVAVSEVATKAVGPWLDVLIRLWLAQAFLTLEIATMMTGPGAESRANTGWSGLLHNLTTSGFGVAVQTLCAVLLLLGLFSRLAAGPMLVQSLFLQMRGAWSDIYLFWAALLGWLIVMGPGPFSLDRLLRRGAETSAVPGVASLRRAYSWVTIHLGPWYKLAIRVWLAAAPAGAAFAATGMSSAMQRGDIAAWLPHVPGMVALLPPSISLLLATLLVLGFGTRLAALALLVMVPISQISLPVDDRLYWLLLLATLALHGPGRFSLDGWLRGYLTALGEPLIGVDADSLPHVVIIGGGFGGIAAARGLRRAPCRITLIDQQNYHLFQPLLYQVATASLSPADIATPIRSMFREQSNVRVVLGRVTAVASTTREVLLGHGRIGYDYLVLATGAQHSYFGRDDWAPFAPGLKRLEDATDIRRRLLVAFEEAENSEDSEMRRGWLTFVIVGGGPTGVELAGAIAELARHGLDREFRSIEPASARVVLVQSAPRLLPTFPEALSADASQALLKLGVEVHLKRKVDQVDAEGVVIGGDRIPARTVLWAAGVTASAAGRWLEAATDATGRLKVGPTLALPGMDEVFAIGDTATADAWRGKPVPGLAPAAKQGGYYVAKVIAARLADRAPPPPFRYRHFGSLATIGRRAAVAEFGPLQFRGPLAWWIWGAAHIAFLVGARNRITVMLEWLWAYLTFRRSTRLITHSGR
jgi:NADH dehydrogenase FAD-containing subunit/uncharacterized membrane protein YphA (DoxX/SURF4 family)